MKIFKTCNCKLPLSYGVLFRKIERELLSHNIGWERFAQYGVATKFVIANKSCALSEDGYLLLHDLVSANGFIKNEDESLTKLAENSNTEWTNRVELLIKYMMHCEVLAERIDFGGNPFVMERHQEYQREIKSLLRKLKLPMDIFKAERYYQIDAMTANVLITASGDETGMELLVNKTIKVRMND